jgi:hypothetical protein
MLIVVYQVASYSVKKGQTIRIGFTLKQLNPLALKIIQNKRSQNSQKNSFCVPNFTLYIPLFGFCYFRTNRGA